MMLATLPAIALLVLGSSVASAYQGRMIDLTEEQRAALDEARELRKDGDKEAARDVLKEAGLNPGFHHMRGHGKLHTVEELEIMKVRHEAIRVAIEENDYSAFKAATVDAPFAEMVTEESFTKLYEAHLLREAGDFSGAHEMLKGLGLPHPGHQGMRGGHRSN